MIESSAIAYLKEFLYAFMLYLVSILTYDANSIMFTFNMKSPMPQICQENLPLQKVQGDLDCKEHSQVAKLDPIGFC